MAPKVFSYFVKRPLRRHRALSIASFIAHFAAFLLLWLVGLSLPITKTVYLVSLTANTDSLIPTNIATELRFGVWGVCATSVLNSPTWLTNNGECFGPRLGYDVPQQYLALVHLDPSVTKVIENGVLSVLILHLVAAVTAFFAFLFSLYLESQTASIIGLVLSIITSLVAGLMLAVDIAAVILVKNKVRQFTHGDLDVNFGNGVWMVLVAVIFSWIGVILLSIRCCYCCGIRKRDAF